MPIYKNRRPLPDDPHVWHYTSVEAVVAMLTSKQIRLTRIDAFNDPFEGSVPKQEIDNQIPAFSGAQSAEMMMQVIAPQHPAMPTVPMRYRDRYGEMTQRRRAKVRSAHAICWRHGNESEPMWRLYCKNACGQCGQTLTSNGGQGLALRTRLSRLEQSVAHLDLVVGPITYRPYHEGDAFNDELDAFMHKRHGFEHEQELRLLHYNEAHFQARSRAVHSGQAEAAPTELAKYVYLDWSLREATEAIVVSPYADAAFEDKARALIGDLDPLTAERIELSVLSERRHGVNF